MITMIEVIDNGTNRKMMAMILCGISYHGDNYLVYLIQRDKDEANVFVSKMIKGSMGYIINNEFANGEKEVLDVLVKRILNKESEDLLKSDGFTILKSVDMDSNLYFDIDNCYVSTVPKNLFKECLVFYGVKNKNYIDRPVVEVVEDNKKFNEGFVNNLVLIIFGVSILIFSLVVVYNVLFK